jgi:dolichol-phosphate mannosyltransferase
MSARPLVSVVFSFRNEADNLPALVERLHTMFAAEPVEYELLFVNDASADRSVEVLTGLRQTNARIKIINMSRRFGVAECARAGMTYARGDAVIYMDTDLQDPPEVIPKLLAAWRQGADVVHTVRSRREGENRLKTWLVGRAYRLIRFGATIDLPVEAGDFKLLSRRAVAHLLSLGESDPYLRGLVVWLGFKQAQVPYVREGRHRGRTHFPFFSRNPWKTVIVGLTSFSFGPIYASGALAVVGLIASVVMLAVAAWLGLQGHTSATALALVGLATFFWATLLGAVSVVGLYVARVYKDVRGRPQYIVASTEGVDPGVDRPTSESRTARLPDPPR